MLIKILIAIVADVVIIGGCGIVKLLCKRYIHIIDKKQNEEKSYVQTYFKN
jgi:hypothetical protein